MKKISCLFLTVLFFISAAVAKDVTMDSVFASLTASKVTCGDFTQEKTAAKLKRPLKSSGNFIFCDEGIVWKTLKPFPSTMAVTKNSMVQTRPDGTKTVTDGSSNEVFKSVAATLSSLFSGSQENLEKYFSIDSFEADSTAWKMLLSPKDKTIAAALNKIELGGAVLAGKVSLDSLKITQSETESTVYVLSNQVYRQELTDAEKALFK